ncbi:helix-turn-helix domain-containing protein [Flavobacterium dankookense]|uniref:BetR domain-containing protein n=1 Tax=Flavobacterium dankookense TaxID=706186 RepID=A0A4R6Q8S2_9FLAO|nr:helix-turn-helix domain-containing protein [Flavobacterium dankookense]TDP58246.1 BetR domain-containing protein [Flavobacterium dankookense]
MSNQELLLKEIRKLLSTSTSLNDEIANILNCSYDAAHRRVSGKSKFSIDETLLLANHFNISLDKLFLKNDKVIVEKTIEIKSLKDMLSYFKKSAERIEQLTITGKPTLYYSAKDIPLFYFMDNTIISKFKAYVWLTLLNSEQINVSFENFVVDDSFMEHTQKLKKIYEKAIVKEVWNDTTINSSLQQILYFYESGLLSFKSATALYLDLKRILKLIKDKSNQPNSNFSIYYNELILLNNNMLIETNEKLTMFIPYTLLGYFIIDNKESCHNVHAFFNQQIINSKPLNQSGIKDQNLFFNRANRKIEYYLEQLNNQVDLLF